MGMKQTCKASWQPMEPHVLEFPCKTTLVCRIITQPCKTALLVKELCHASGRCLHFAT